MPFWGVDAAPSCYREQSSLFITFSTQPNTLSSLLCIRMLRFWSSIFISFTAAHLRPRSCVQRESSSGSLYPGSASMVLFVLPSATVLNPTVKRKMRYTRPINAGDLKAAAEKERGKKKS
ncbi:hypothetical protein CRENBAI_012270 [Crenichthys baileyi]|uniref:Uncharacterized protein n=1 Tax=Crenichthys baileyi TaxID=28760 RepID=A0AAV9R487_9TELE